MTAEDETNRPAVPPALPPKLYRSISGSSSQPLKPPRRNRTYGSIRTSDVINEAIYEDPDALLSSIPDVSQSEAKPRPIPAPRIKSKLNPPLYDTNNTTKTHDYNTTNSNYNTANSTYNRNEANPTYDAITTRTTNANNTTNASSTTYNTDTTHKASTTTKTSANTVPKTHNSTTHSSTSASTAYCSNRTNNTNIAKSSDTAGNTNNDASYKSRTNDYMTSRSSLILPETKDVTSTTAARPQNYYSETNLHQDVKFRDITRKKRPPPLPPPHIRRSSSTLDLSNSENSDSTSRERIPPLPRPRVYHSNSTLDLVSNQSRETPPLFDSEEETYITSTSSLYTNNRNPPYLQVLPDNDHYLARTSRHSYEEDNQSSYSSICSLSGDNIDELLQWFKRVSRQSDALSLYGLSIEDEIRTLHQQAMNMRKARRLYSLLIMKRKDDLQKVLTELNAICEKLDKVKKTNKAMGIAGGTTGAVGGVTAVVGIALAPVTMGVSLIATAVGAGIAASAGGFGAHAAKANKKIVNRETVEKLVDQYKSNVVDKEHCLTYILSVMKELRRHNVDRLRRAGANPDALRMASLSQAVFSNDIYNSKKMSPTNPGGMTSESLLKQFSGEFDEYFTEKGGQKLKKSNKSKFSGRVCALAKNLEEELKYMKQMWEVLS